MMENKRRKWFVGMAANDTRHTWEPKGGYYSHSAFASLV